ncbi:MAG: retropepsin-like aspartic protease [Clostridium sp.]
MIQLRREHGLILCSLNIVIDSRNMFFKNVLVDTGSATTLINSNHIELDGSETIRKAYGVGGYETILKKKINSFEIDGLVINDFKISLGEMDYGIELDCILGLDILHELGALIDLKSLKLDFKR